MCVARASKLQNRMQTIKPKIDDRRPIMRLRLLFCFLAVFTFLRSDVSGRTLQSDAGLVVADSELASEAGMAILKRGGNAVDAAIATAFALSVVDQASSGLGGGGFMVIYRAKDKKSFALDFRETAPQASRKELYMKDGKAVPSLSLTGALAVARARRSGRVDRGAQAFWNAFFGDAGCAGHQTRERRVPLGCDAAHCD